MDDDDDACVETVISELLVKILTPSWIRRPRLRIWYEYFGDWWACNNILAVFTLHSCTAHAQKLQFYFRASDRDSDVTIRFCNLYFLPKREE